jgi:hypothetical protein
MILWEKMSPKLIGNMLQILVDIKTFIIYNTRDANGFPGCGMVKAHFKVDN